MNFFLHLKDYQNGIRLCCCVFIVYINKLLGLQTKMSRDDKKTHIVLIN